MNSRHRNITAGDGCNSEEAEYRALFRDVTQAMAQGLIVFDNWKILFANNQAIELLDIPAELLAPGRPWRDFCCSPANAAITAPSAPRPRSSTVSPR